LQVLERILARRREVDRLLSAAMVIAPFACVVATPVAVWRLGSWPAARFLALCAAPLFLAAPWWVRERSSL
jgi:hypothetical protein